jgi:hypothetical protein
MAYQEKLSNPNDLVTTQGASLGPIQAHSTNERQETPANRLYRTAVRTEETTRMLRRLIEELTGEGYPEEACQNSTEVTLGQALGMVPDYINREVEEQRQLVNTLRSILLGD